MKKPNIVIVGPGNIGLAHTMVVNEIENCELYGICDTNAAAGKPIADEFGVKFFGSVDELCKDPAVDGAIVCVPDEHHLSVCAQLARAGKHILVEKPITYTSAEGEELKKICEEAGVVFSVAQCTEFFPGTFVGRSKVKSGEVGDIIHFACRHIADVECADMIKHRAHIMFYLGVHDVYNILTVTGRKIVSAFAKQSTVRLGDYHDAVICLFTLDNGAIGSLELGWDMPVEHGGDIMDEVFYGTKGMLSVELHDYKSCLNNYGPGKAAVDVSSFYCAEGQVGGAFAEEDRDFAKRIMDPSIKPRVDTDVAIEAVKVIEAVFRSLESGNEEKVIF